MALKSNTYLSTQDSTSLAIFTSAQILIGTTANACVIIYFLVVCGIKRLTPTDKLTLNLAISDLISLTTYLPWRTYLLFVRKPSVHYRIYTSLYVVCIYATGNAVLSIAFERLVAVVWPLRYKTLMTTRMCWTFIATSWTFAIIFGIVHGLSYTVDLHDEYELYLCAIPLAQLVVISGIYGVILKTSLRHWRNIVNMKRELKGKYLFLTKSVYTTLAIVCLFYITFFPNVIYRIYSNLDESLPEYDKHAAWRWLTAFTFLNSVCNPFVYFFGIERYRTRFTKSAKSEINRRSKKKQARKRNDDVAEV